MKLWPYLTPKINSKHFKLHVRVLSIKPLEKIGVYICNLMLANPFRNDIKQKWPKNN